MDLAGGPWPGCTFSEESALTAFPMEDFRQPTAQSHPPRLNDPASPWLDGITETLALDFAGVGNFPDTLFDDFFP